MELKSAFDGMNLEPAVIPADNASESEEVDAARSALMNLGFRATQVEEVIAEVAGADKTVEEMVREGLKLLR